MAIGIRQEEIKPNKDGKYDPIPIMKGYDNLVISVEGNGSFNVKLLGSVSEEEKDEYRTYYPIFLVSLTQGSKILEITSNELAVMDVRFLQYAKFEVTGDVKITARFSEG